MGNNTLPDATLGDAAPHLRLTLRQEVRDERIFIRDPAGEPLKANCEARSKREVRGDEGERLGARGARSGLGCGFGAADGAVHVLISPLFAGEVAIALGTRVLLLVVVSDVGKLSLLCLVALRAEVTLERPQGGGGRTVGFFLVGQAEVCAERRGRGGVVERGQHGNRRPELGLLGAVIVELVVHLREDMEPWVRGRERERERGSERGEVRYKPCTVLTADVCVQLNSNLEKVKPFLIFK